MTKKLSERIAERIEREKSNSRVVNKASLISLKNDIQEARSAGWSLRQIWITLSEEKKIKVTYQAFCKQIKAYLDNETKQFETTLTQKQKHKASVNEQKITPQKNKSSSFEFSNVANKEDIL
ncbi:TraK family protein [Pseudoalteromonas sp. SSM20]|uniref:TraK family protein n=1 Tax=Pseudoalteromonas sp. SSM20 TaxID=3139394 RepID=UPI003BAD4362